MNNNKIVAAVRRKDSDLQHWKYIKKVKTTGGKWRYIYDDSELKKYENEITETTITGEPPNRTISSVKYMNANKERKSSIVESSDVFPNSRTISRTTVKMLGTRAQKYAKAEKWVYDNFYGSNNVGKKVNSFARSTISNGRIALQNLLKKRK